MDYSHPGRSIPGWFLQGRREPARAPGLNGLYGPHNSPHWDIQPAGGEKYLFGLIGLIFLTIHLPLISSRGEIIPV